MSTRLPKRIQAYWNLAIMAEHQTGVEHLLLLATMEHESECGNTLQPQGPAGTGDWQPRHWHRYADRKDPERFRHRRPSREEYERIMAKKLEDGATVPELCMPADGLGWGRGLMQPDWADPDNSAFLAEVMPDGRLAWQDPWRNIRFGAAKLARYIQAFMGTEAPEFFGLAAYNAGVGHVQKTLLSSGPLADFPERRDAVDLITTGKNYASHVLDCRNQYRRALQTPEEPDNA